MQMQVALTMENHCARRSTWHIEWCTKYRYKMMQKLGNRNIVAACIRQAAHRHGITILILSVMPEHIHIAVSLPHGMDEVRAVKLLKGFSAWKIFQVKKKFLLRYPKRHFWSRGYMASTIGIDTEKAIRYILSQEKHHNVIFS